MDGEGLFGAFFPVPNWSCHDLKQGSRSQLVRPGRELPNNFFRDPHDCLGELVLK